jgi:hypothetical protein
MIRAVLWALVDVARYLLSTGAVVVLAYIVVTEASRSDWLLAGLYALPASVVTAWWCGALRDDIRRLRIRARAVRIARAARPARTAGFPPTYRGWSS